jgi:hypothetical protein
MNIINSIIVFLYYYYKSKESSIPIFRARASFILLIDLLLIPLFFYLEGLFKIQFLNLISNLNPAIVFIIFIAPQIIIIYLFSIKEQQLTSFTEEEIMLFKQKGRKYLFIIVLSIIIIWLTRILTYSSNG